MTQLPVGNPGEHRTFLEISIDVSLSGGFLLRLNLVAEDDIDVALATNIVSVSYTDIIVSPTTNVSTSVQTAIVPSQAFQTQTETVYSPTVVKAITTALLKDGSSATSLMRRRNENRGGCKPIHSRTSSLSSSTSVSSLSSLPTSVLFPITSNRPSHKAYYSACACITVHRVGLTSTVYVNSPTTAAQTLTTLTTTTSTLTATVTLVSGGKCVANPVCALAGFDIEYYENVAGEPYYVGWTRSTNGGVTLDANNCTLVYEGLFHAPTTGS
ncbi:hypothetical protein HDV63DRAFT_401791 [Trichoderma sp. SZMC 28014]